MKRSEKMNKTLETVGAVHTSQFLNERNAIALSYEGVFCVDAVCAGSVASGCYCALNFINYIEDS